MTDSLSTSEIKRRSISGAKWLVVMNAVGMPSAFLIALMLGRVGPEALGAYALAQVLIGVITTFVVYGGPPVLSVFMPKLGSPTERGRFLFSYLVILLVTMTTVLALFWTFPAFLEFLLQHQFELPSFGWFIALSVVIVATETFANAASGLMLIKTRAIARQMMRMILFPVVVFFFVFNREFLAHNATICVLGGFLVGYIAAAIVSIVEIIRDKRLSMRLGWFLPPGFWAFSLSTMLSTVFSFLHTNFDRMCVLGSSDLEGLGVYQAVISISTLVGVVPMVLGPALVPMFSSLLVLGDMNAVRRAYSLLQQTGCGLITGAALFIISFATELLSLFGEEYASYDYLLSIFCVTTVVTSSHFGNSPVLTAYEKNVFRFCISASQNLIQILGTLIFMRPFGILAIVFFKVATSVYAQSASILYVTRRMNKGFVLPRSYWIAIMVSSACALLSNTLFPEGWVISSFVFAAFAFLFFIFSGIRISAIRALVKAALPWTRKTTGI